MNSINEVGSNLTGGQIQRILDYLLYKALNPLVIHCIIVDNTLPQILINIISDRRRKISTLPFEVAVEKISVAINSLSSDRKKAFTIISELRIERNVWSSLIHKFLEYRTYYQGLLIDQTSEDKVRAKELEDAVGCKSNLFSIFNHVDTFFKYYSTFKSMIISQYIYKSHQYAHKVDNGEQEISHEDLTQSLLLSVSKGIDKYDSDSGALSSYLGYWMLNTSTSMSSSFTNTALAFDVPTSYRQKIAKRKTIDTNFAESLSLLDIDQAANSVPHLEDTYIETDATNRVLQLIKAADLNGVYRLSNSITEFFSREEQILMGLT